MPNLTTLTTNILQIEALRKVMRHTSKHDKELLQQKEQKTVMLRGLNNSTHRERSLHTGTLLDTNDDTATHGQSYFQHRASLAESTIACYNNINNNGNLVYKSRDTNIEARLHPEIGLQHPYDSTVNF